MSAKCPISLQRRTPLHKALTTSLTPLQARRCRDGCPRDMWRVGAHPVVVGVLGPRGRILQEVARFASNIAILGGWWHGNVFVFISLKAVLVVALVREAALKENAPHLHNECTSADLMRVASLLPYVLSLWEHSGIARRPTSYT